MLKGKFGFGGSLKLPLNNSHFIVCRILYVKRGEDMSGITIDILRQRLQARQHKLTTQRRTVLEVFIAHPGEHLSAEDVYGILRGEDIDIGLATVYRSLELLANLNILQRMEFGDGCSRYEIGTMSPDEHQHHIRRQGKRSLLLHKPHPYFLTRLSYHAEGTRASKKDVNLIAK